MADDNLKARKEALERYIKDAKSGLLLADDHIDPAIVTGKQIGRAHV